MIDIYMFVKHNIRSFKLNDFMQVSTVYFSFCHAST